MGRKAALRLTTLWLLLLKTPVSEWGYRNKARAEPSARVTYAVYCLGERMSKNVVGLATAFLCTAVKIGPKPPSWAGIMMIVAKSTMKIMTSLTRAIIAGARNPLV